MKEHIPAIVALIALGMLVGAAIALTHMGNKAGDIAMLGIQGGIVAIASGLTPSFSRAPQGAQTKPTEPTKDK